MNRLFYFILFSVLLVANIYANSSDKKLDKYNKLELQSNKAKVLVQTPPIKANNPNYRSLPNIGIQSESRDCVNCEFDYTEYGSACCDSAWEDFLITCAELEANYGWDCAGCDCPGDGAPDNCGDGNCTGNENYDNCPEDCNAPGECDAGYVSDCVDDDCCPETWIGDGFEDCEDQAYGCDLTCYDNDGGDCGPACPDGEVECWDGSCATSDEDCPLTCEEQGGTICWDGSCAIGEDCPDAGCSESGGFESWIADGYCDSSNNNAACNWDGGDCCGSTCINNTYDCSSTTTGPCVNECLDPNANDDCCIDNDCPFTCEGQELITCWDGSCAENETECPEANCSDTPCSSYLSTLTCPQIEELYGHDCSICEEEGACPITCEDEGLFTCPTGQCATSADDCNTCESPDEAIEGANNSDGYDQYYTFSISQAGFLTLSSAGAGVDTKLYLYAACEDVDIDNYPYGDYVAYNDDWSSSQFGECPNCDYWGESYIYVGVPAGEYVIISSDQYNSDHASFTWTLSFAPGVEGCTNPEAENYNSEANIDDGSCEFADGVFFVTCDGGSYQTEVSWDLMNVNNDGLDDVVVLSGGAPFNGAITLEPGDYYLSAIDSWGDGWNGNIWTIIDSESNEILSYTIEEGSEGTSETFTVESGGCEGNGDVNGDEIINILDVLTIVNAINGGDTSAVLECGDINDDEIINILDVVAIINLILGE
jgi:hypothetical protein